MQVGCWGSLSGHTVLSLEPAVSQLAVIVSDKYGKLDEAKNYRWTGHVGQGRTSGRRISSMILLVEIAEKESFRFGERCSRMVAPVSLNTNQTSQ